MGIQNARDRLFANKELDWRDRLKFQGDSFVLTAAGLKQLESKVPSEVVQKLTFLEQSSFNNLLTQGYSELDAFLEALENFLGEEDLKKYQSIILEAAQIKNLLRHEKAEREGYYKLSSDSIEALESLPEFDSSLLPFLELMANRFYPSKQDFITDFLSLKGSAVDSKQIDMIQDYLFSKNMHWRDRLKLNIEKDWRDRLS